MPTVTGRISTGMIGDEGERFRLGEEFPSSCRSSAKGQKQW